jgi:hypothetical protein
MPVVSISIPPDLFHELEERRAKRTRSGTWTDYLKVGTRMDGHRCPPHPKPKWPDGHRCSETLVEHFRDGLKRFPGGWITTIDGKRYHVKPEEE